MWNRENSSLSLLSESLSPHDVRDFTVIRIRMTRWLLALIAIAPTGTRGAEGAPKRAFDIGDDGVPFRSFSRGQPPQCSLSCRRQCRDSLHGHACLCLSVECEDGTSPNVGKTD